MSETTHKNENLRRFPKRAKMSNLNTCRHVRSCVFETATEEHFKQIRAPICHSCQEHGSNFWLCLYPGCNFVACGDADGGQDHSAAHFNEYKNHAVQVISLRFKLDFFLRNH